MWQLAAIVMTVLSATATHAQAPGNQPAPGKPTFGPYRGKSWVAVDPASLHILDEGQPFEVTVHYNLDAGEAIEGKWAIVSVGGVGPWLGPRRKNQDGPSGHIHYRGLRDKRRVTVGRGKVTFKFTAPKCKWRDEIQMIAFLVDGHGGAMPFQSRSPRIVIRNISAPVVLDTDVPGSLFTYDEPVVVNVRLRHVPKKLVGTHVDLTYTITNTRGKRLIADKKVRVRIEKAEQVIALPLDIAERGVFLVEVDVAGERKIGRAETMVGRVPDVVKLTGPTGRTQFGGTTIIAPGDPDRLEAGLRAVRRLGWSASRSFVKWRTLESVPGEYDLDSWETPLRLARQYGIDTVITVTTPPVWARQGPHYGHWGAVPKWDQWEKLVRTFTTRFKGRFYAWEWLNEITPGSWWQGTAAEYVKLCRIGTQTAKAIDPNLKTHLAGGMWPRSFRLDVLGAGAGKYIDVMPLHYNSGPGVREARSDLDMLGLGRVAIWDNESSRPHRLWMDPLEKDLTDTTQAAWLLEQWPSELVAGCERIIWFGNRSPVGGWSPFFDDLTPRPVAATLAVLASKLHGATPLGSFRLGDKDVWHLFERDGRAIMVARAPQSETARLPVGPLGAAIVTDYQGNAKRIVATGGAVEIALGPLGQFVELDRIDVVRMFAAIDVGRKEAATLTSTDRGLVDSASIQRVPILRGQTAEVPIRVTNPFDKPIKIEIALRTGQGTDVAESPRRTLSIDGGQTWSDVLTIPVPEAAPVGDRPVEVTVRFARADLPLVTKRLVLGVIAPEMLGNLATGGDFETDADADGKPDHWRLWNAETRWAPTDFPGTGKRCVRMNATTASRYNHVGGPQIAVSPGQKYLYSAWVYCDGMAGGSNINQRGPGGRLQTVHEPKVFGLRSTACWQLYTKVYHAGDGVTAVGPAPVVSAKRPDGVALYDNIRWTLYRGSDYAAECHRATGKITVDGKLGDWAKARCPVPLLGPNQLTRLDENYRWSPANLSGVAHVVWDKANLYVAVTVHDDTLKVTGDSWAGGDPARGDCLRLAIDPARGADGAATEAFELIVARGTSGRPVVIRPKARAGGLRSGHLYRDSSEMEAAVVRTEGAMTSDAARAPWMAPTSGRTTYEMRIPFTMLGRLRGSLGAAFGLTLSVTDNDGATDPAASMTWGRGTHPQWQPRHFGCVTFIE
jgi:hypothetical protein